MKPFVFTSLKHLLLALLLICSSKTPVLAVTLKELIDDPHLTPETFARHFSGFGFQLSEVVQRPEAFLASKKGDCDDYATLAADLLRSKGYTTRLVVVFMPKDIHVVCYVAETSSYLDYNCRDCPNPAIPCEGTLSDIADKVAKSFHASWHCVSEFTFKEGVRHFVFSDFPQVKKAPVSPKRFATADKAAALRTR